MACRFAQLTMDDYDDVVAFWRSQEGVGLNESDGKRQIAGYLTRNPGMSFIVREAGKVVGAVLCGHDGRRGYLHHLAVASSHRRKGLGRSLVARCLKSLRRAGIQRCNIFLFADNPQGRSFWQSIGYRPRADLLLMQRSIDRA